MLLPNKYMRQFCLRWRDGFCSLESLVTI